jgi:omega-amidase
MLVTLFQYEVAWLDPESNLSKIEYLCSKVSGQSDLLVLPEMFNTGYIMHPNELDLKWQEETIQHLMTISAKYGMTIAGSIPMFKSGHYYNTFIAVNAFGIIAEYDKMHLFSIAGEANHYEKGKQAITFDLQGFKILPLICYDLRFPYISYIESPVDIIIYTANWPKTRISHWKSL